MSPESEIDFPASLRDVHGENDHHANAPRVGTGVPGHQTDGNEEDVPLAEVRAQAPVRKRFKFSRLISKTRGRN